MESEVKEESKVDRLLGNVVECMETRVDLMAIEVQDKLSEILASMAAILVLGVLLSSTFLMLSIAAAIYLSHALNSSYIGFIYVGAFHLLIALVLYGSRKRMIKLPVINALLRKINFNEED